MTEIDDKQILNEIMGTFTPSHTYLGTHVGDQNINGPNRPNPNIYTTGATQGFCNSLEGWQRTLVNNLAGDQGRDQYVIALPGGGKTAPIFCYWSHHLLGLNTLGLRNTIPTIGPNVAQLFETSNRSTAPKLLIMVPVIVLAQQTAMEVRKILASIMMQFYNYNPAYFIQHMFDNNNLKRLLNQLTHLDQELEIINNRSGGVAGVAATPETAGTPGVIGISRQQTPPIQLVRPHGFTGTPGRTLPNKIVIPPVPPGPTAMFRPPQFSYIPVQGQPATRGTPSTPAVPGVQRNQYYPDQGNLQRIHTSRNSVNKSLKDEVEKYIGNMVNEMVYIKTGSDTSNTTFENALVYVTIYESAPSIVKRINNLRLTMIDEAHLLQESGIKDDDNSRATQIMSSLFDVMKNIERLPNNRLVMLSGTINPRSATRITTYFNECFGRNFSPEARAAPPEASNRSQLSVIVNERINTDDEIVNSVVRNVAQQDWGQLYVLFSTARIVRIVEMCIDKLGIKNIENSSPGGYVSNNVFTNLGQDRQNRAGYTLDAGAVDRMSIPSGKQLLVANITNPILRQAVLRGIGFISRKIPDNALEERFDLEMNDTDKLIVAKLFRERKINVLLATDSVGIGVNIDVKDLYIPQVKKYNKNVQNTVNISLRDLSQILNRAGRGATPIASIQTSKPNVEMVMNALYANSSDLPEVGEISRLGISPCDRRSFMNLYHKAGKGMTKAGKGMTKAVAKVKSWF